MYNTLNCVHYLESLAPGFRGRRAWQVLIEYRCFTNALSKGFMKCSLTHRENIRAHTPFIIKVVDAGEPYI